jgi:hypothetical protein
MIQGRGPPEQESKCVAALSWKCVLRLSFVLCVGVLRLQDRFKLKECWALLSF